MCSLFICYILSILYFYSHNWFTRIKFFATFSLRLRFSTDSRAFSKPTFSFSFVFFHVRYETNLLAFTQSREFAHEKRLFSASSETERTKLFFATRVLVNKRMQKRQIHWRSSIESGQHSRKRLCKVKKWERISSSWKDRSAVTQPFVLMTRASAGEGFYNKAWKLNLSAAFGMTSHCVMFV